MTRNISGGRFLNIEAIESNLGVIDVTNSEAFVVRKNNDGDDVFTVNTQDSKVDIVGDLKVTGTLTYGSQNVYESKDNIIKLADGNEANTVDIGFYGQYVSSGTKYTGLVRDVSDSGTWKLFSNLTSEPTTSVNFTGVTYDNLRIGDLTAGNISGTLTTATQGNITSIGTLTSLALSGNQTISGNNYIRFGATTNSNNLDIGGTGNYTTNPSIKTGINSNLHIDSGSGAGGLFLNFYRTDKPVYFQNQTTTISSSGLSTQGTLSTSGIGSIGGGFCASSDGAIRSPITGWVGRFYSFNSGVGWEGNCYFGGFSTPQVVIGSLNNAAQIGAHSSALDAWAELNIGHASVNTNVSGPLSVYGLLTPSTTTSNLTTATFGAIQSQTINGFTFFRLGNVVCMKLPTYSFTAAATASAITSTLIDTQFRPSSAIETTYVVKQGSTSTVAEILISNTGTISLYAGLDNADFTSGSAYSWGNQIIWYSL